MLMVTTPTDPVFGFAPNSPPPRFLSSLLSSRSLQHMLLASSGFMSLLMKFEKYGIPYFAVISHIGSSPSLSHLKSLVMLYVGIGKVNGLPLASPSYMMSANAYHKLIET